MSSIRTPTWTRRLLAAGAAVAATGGVITTALAVTDREPDVVTEVESAVLEPAMLDAIDTNPTSDTDPTSGAGDGSTRGDTAADDTTTTVPAPFDDGTTGGPASADEAALSPLSALLGPTYSVIPEQVEPRARPVRLEIDTIDVSRFPVRAVGLDPSGELEVPDETEIGWYQYGATAGDAGATVLAAHVSWNRTTGPFARLGAVDPGDQVAVTLDDGTVRRYVVTERAMYGKLELPRERIWRNTGAEELVLITCGGDFNPEIRRYRDNIVVYATPID